MVAKLSAVAVSVLLAVAPVAGAVSVTSGLQGSETATASPRDMSGCMKFPWLPWCK